MKLVLPVLGYVMLLWPASGWSTTYYVSESAGANSNSGLSHAQAWRTLDKIEDESFASGDKVLLSCGDIWNRSEGDWGAGETQIEIGNINGIAIGAYYMDAGTHREVDGSTYTCPGSKPLVDGNVTTHSGGTSSPFPPAFSVRANSDNITIKDIRVQNYYGGFLARPTNNHPGPITNGAFERLETYNTGRYGISLDGNWNHRLDNNVSDWTVAGCRVIRSYMAFEGEGGWGIALMLKFVDNYEIYDNEVGQSHGEGIGGWGGADNGEIYNNLVYETGSVSIYLSCCHNVKVHHNFVVGTTNQTWQQRLGRTRAGIGFGGETDDVGYVDSSGCEFHHNVVVGRPRGFSLTDPHDDADSTADGGFGTNYVYHNLFIDNGHNYGLWNNDGGELTIEFRNNLSVVNDTAHSQHVANRNPGPEYTWLGNGWDDSDVVDSDYTHANDVVGDPALVNPAPCPDGWYQCATHDATSWGDAAFTSASIAFVDTAADLGSEYQHGLGAASQWPGSVVTVDQNGHGSGWEFGAYVYQTGCTESWTCSDWLWSACTGGEQTGTRTCTDENSCGTEDHKPAEVTTRSCADAELVAHWSMDSDAITGTHVLDLSGNGRDAAIMGAPQPSAGMVCGALHFDGLSDYLDTDITEDLDRWTVSVWVRADSDPGSDKDAGPVMKQENFIVSWDHQGAAFRAAAGLSVGGTWHAAGFAEVTGGSWYHLAATYDGESLKTFVGGVLITENTAPSGSPDSSTQALKIARHAVDDFYFAGDIDDVRIYDSALDSEEIQALACADCDGDGYGAPGSSCPEPQEDCDDARGDIFPGATETCNGLDDDCDGQPDEDFALDSNPDNCGSCGHVCSLAHATAACVSSTCVIDVCAADYEDCNSTDSDGCETDTLTDTGHCGGCTLACSAVPHGQPVCSSGTCGFACDSGWGDCDSNSANGCEEELVEGSCTGVSQSCGGCWTVHASERVWAALLAVLLLRWRRARTRSLSAP